jgi:hypothetical protein
MKKITLHGPEGQGTKDDQYFFSIVDADGELLAQSVPFSSLNELLNAVQVNFSGVALDSSDLGTEAPPERIIGHV